MNNGIKTYDENGRIQIDSSSIIYKMILMEHIRATGKGITIDFSNKVIKGQFEYSALIIISERKTRVVRNNRTGKLERSNYSINVEGESVVVTQTHSGDIIGGSLMVFAV